MLVFSSIFRVADEILLHSLVHLWLQHWCSIERRFILSVSRFVYLFVCHSVAYRTRSAWLYEVSIHTASRVTIRLAVCSVSRVRVRVSYSGQPCEYISNGYTHGYGHQPTTKLVIFWALSRKQSCTVFFAPRLMNDSTPMVIIRVTVKDRG